MTHNFIYVFFFILLKTMIYQLKIYTNFFFLKKNDEKANLVDQKVLINQNKNCSFHKKCSKSFQLLNQNREKRKCFKTQWHTIYIDKTCSLSTFQLTLSFMNATFLIFIMIFIFLSIYLDYADDFVCMTKKNLS
jgi:hypothetical protein